jgi:nicotinic acid mononucleotide adenylyltransferase
MSNTIELYKKIQNYTGPKIVLIVTGGGIGVTDLVKTMGASKLIHAVHIPYDSDEAIRFVTQNIRLPLPEGMEPLDLDNIKHVSESWAKHLCNAGLIEYQHTDCKIIAITAALSTNKYRKGDNHAWIASGTSKDNIKTHHIKLEKLTEEEHEKFFPGYVDWKRGSEDRQITKFVIDSIFDNTTAEVAKEDNDISTTNDIDIKSAYERLSKNPLSAFIIKRDGHIEDLETFLCVSGKNTCVLDVIPGSFDPLHDTHREIYDTAYKSFLKNNNPNKNSKGCFEISIERFGKEDLSCEEIQKRAKQFRNYAHLLITKSPLFIDKIGILAPYVGGLNFHIGADTVKRLKLTQNSMQIQALAATFVVYNRIVDGKLCSVKTEFADQNLPTPFNVIGAMSNISRTKESMECSSTAIRNNAKQEKHFYSLSDIGGLNLNPNH